MTQDEITRMAREAGFDAGVSDELWGPRHYVKKDDMMSYKRFEAFQRFAALVAAVEREACAKVAEKTVCDTHLPTAIKIYGSKAAAAIRARSNK